MTEVPNGFHPVEVPSDVTQSFTEAAHGARTCHRMLTMSGAVRSGSPFATLAEYGPPVTVNEVAYGYLLAAAEHLLYWADTMAPLKFHPEQRNEITLRPTNTLARAGMEASAQALWLLNSNDPREVIRRHIAMHRMELAKHLQSEVDPEAKAAVKAEEDAFLETAKAAGVATDDLAVPAGYRAFVRTAADVDGISASADELDVIWRYASGVAHGHRWVNAVMTELVEADTATGEAQLVRVPSLERLTLVIQTAVSMLQVGVLRYLHLLGADIGEQIYAAHAWLAQVMPLTDESHRGELLGGIPFPPSTPPR